MGLGDEIMALGRAEQHYEATGEPSCFVAALIHTPRDHPAWHGNPAWKKCTLHEIIDGGGERPYIQHWKGRRAIFNQLHTPRAGRIFLSESDYAIAKTLEPPYAIVAPSLKTGASPNKDWGEKRWAEVIKDFPIPVYQLLPDARSKPIEGARGLLTPDFRAACAIIENAAVVMTAEGGTHHMAASMKTPAVVVFGSFVPPRVTGYDFHYNIAVESEHGYCGNWDPCPICKQSLESITPQYVREKAILMLESFYAE